MTRRTTFLGDVRRVARWVRMDELDQLPARMAAAAARLDYEEARRLRDLIALVRGGGHA